MKTFLLAITVFFCVCRPAYAEKRYTFFESYNPSSTSFTYTASGDITDNTATVFPYDKKTIFINAELMETTNMDYQIEGRAVGELDTWSILDSGDIGGLSEPESKNIAIDVTELVDYLRVGLRIIEGDSQDLINVRGIFRRGN